MSHLEMDILPYPIPFFIAKFPTMNIQIQEPIIFTTTDKQSDCTETQSNYEGILLTNVSIKPITTAKRKKNIMENDLTLKDIVSKKIKFDYPEEKNQTPKKAPIEIIPPEIYLAKKSLKTKNDKWTLNEIETFYKGVEIWGTDFSLISVMLPTKSRNQIKRKFLLEEKKENPKILIGYSKKNSEIKSNKELEDLSKIISGQNIFEVYPDFKNFEMFFKDNKVFFFNFNQIKI